MSEKSNSRFVRIGTKAYLNRDGHPTPLAVWRVFCRACGEPFEVMTPAQRAEGAKLPTRVHCDKHKLKPGWGKNAVQKKTRAKRPAR